MYANSKISSWIFLMEIMICIAAKCTIREDEVGYKEALCQNQRFTSVPASLPADIRRLDLSRNNLTTIKQCEFSRYMYLEEIFIDDNNLQFLNSSAFCGLPLLRRLSMSGNDLHVSKAYPSGVFEPLSNLTMLDISRNMKNRYKDRVFYAVPMNKLNSLHELSIDLVYNPDFCESFRELNNLNTLRFNFCYINSLYNKTFTNLPGNITELYMNTCADFFTVEADALTYFPKLSVLNFTTSYMQLTQALKTLYPLQNKTMKALLFRGITYDVDVILTREMMKYISTICIKTLDLSSNNIVSIKDKSLMSFQHPECFENVIVSANRFALNLFAVDFYIWFVRMTNLKVFDYSYVPIQFKKIIFLNVAVDDNDSISEQDSGKKGTVIIPTVTFPSQLKFIRFTHLMALNGIKEIKLINSSLSHFEISYFDTDIFPVFTFEGYNNLEHLDISGISSTITIGKFSMLSHLKNLTMKHTELYKLIRTNVAIFNWVPNLRKLDISNNFMWYIKKNSLGELPYLTHLNLSYNIIKIIPEALTQFDNLIELDLSNNLITTLQESIRKWIDRQQRKFGSFTLYLDKNTFFCSCETTDFLLWIYNTKANLDNNKNYSCWIPDKGNTNYTRNVVDDYHHYFVHCSNKVWLKIGISLLTSFISVLVCIIVLYNFRWRMIFFFYRKFRRFAEKGLEVNFKYDVYISYSDDSAAFVKKVLAPKIEHEWGLKMCCEDRDFGIGESSADMRAISIHQSRHIIFLVTPSFIRNEWSSFEIERAKYEKISKDLQKIVVITKDIEFNDIPFEFATIWKDVFLIEWPIDKEGLKMTWQKLRLWFF